MLEVKIDNYLIMLSIKAHWCVFLDHDFKWGSYSDLEEPKLLERIEIYKAYQNRLTVFVWEK